MKKIIISVASATILSACILTVNSHDVLAESQFNYLKDNDTLVLSDDGGFFTGTGIVTVTDNTNNIVRIYDLDEPLNNINTMLITGKQYKDMVKKTEYSENLTQNFFNELYGENPPVGSKVTKLSFNQSYYSNPFTGAGWRFAGSYFKAVNTTGQALRWESYNTDAYVGDEAAAKKTKKTGKGVGTFVKKGENNGTYINGKRTYYVNYPASNTRYWVGNVD